MDSSVCCCWEMGESLFQGHVSPSCWMVQRVLQNSWRSRVEADAGLDQRAVGVFSILTPPPLFSSEATVATGLTVGFRHQSWNQLKLLAYLAWRSRHLQSLESICNRCFCCGLEWRLRRDVHQYEWSSITPCIECWVVATDGGCGCGVAGSTPFSAQVLLAECLSCLRILSDKQ